MLRPILITFKCKGSRLIAFQIIQGIRSYIYDFTLIAHNQDQLQKTIVLS